MRSLARWLLVASTLLVGTPGLAGPDDAPPPKEDLGQLVDRITARVVKLRGLSRKRPIARALLSKKEIRARLSARLAQEYRPQEIKAEEQVLKRLGLLPPDADYYQLVVELLSDQVVGFYDPERRQLYVASWMPMKVQKPALAHEIAHALQDQHFDLRRITSGLKGQADTQLARAALVEGDGTGVMLEYMLGVGLGSLPPGLFGVLKPMLNLFSSPVFRRTPRFLREALLFPYIHGLDFIITLRKRFAWSQIDRIYRRLPDSTEQILHPEKYAARERPVRIAAQPLAALKPGRLIWQDTLGEAQLRFYLEEHLPAAQAATATGGWGGDRAVAYELPGMRGAVLVLDTVWDGEQDALEFEAAQRTALAKLAGASSPQPGAGPFPAPDGTLFAVHRTGDRVVCGYGVPAGAWPKVIAEVTRTWRVTRPR